LIERGGAARHFRREPHRYHYHQVQDGETVDQIARSYGVSADQIAKENRLSAAKLKAGDVLRIPLPGKK
jgi:LysM repeat protein